jgi:hypothetical protein
MHDEDELTGTEDQIRLSISRLLNPPKNRILTVEQWWRKCVEIDNQILVAIKDGRLPKKLMLSKHVRNIRDYLTKGLVTKSDHIRQFQVVSDYLQEQATKPDDVRYRDYEELMKA